MTYTSFSKDYTKLSFDVFPTIRSPNYAESRELGIGSRVEIRIKNKTFFLCEIIAIETKKLKNIPLAFLKYDAAPHPINSHQDFADLINSFTQYKNTKVENMKSIIWFKKMEKWIK